MNISRKSFQRISALVMVSLLMGASVALADEKLTLVGRVLDIDGPTLKTNRLKEAKWYQAYPKMSTYLRERLIADSGTTATIEFAAGGRAVVAPGTQIEIIGPRKAQIVSGTAWLKFDKDRLNKEEFQIQTSGGVMGVEGTEFFVETDENGQTTLTVVEGTVNVNSGGQKQVVQGGEEAEFKDGVKKFAKFVAEGGLSEWGIRRAAYKKMGLDENHPLLRGVDFGLSRVGYGRLNSVFYSRELRYASRAARFAVAPEQAAQEELNREIGRRSPIGGFNIGIGKSKPAEPATPKAVALQEGRPATSWSKVGKAKSYAVVVAKDQEAEDVVWFGKTSEPKFSYPSYGPKLEAGVTYYVLITPLDKEGLPYRDGDKELSGNTSFVSTGHSPVYMPVSGVAVESAEVPTVKWAELKDAYAYRVRFDESTGSESAWVGESKAPSYSYPKDARALPTGEYQVVVEAYDSSGVKMGESAPSSYSATQWQATGLDGPARSEPTESREFRAVGQAR